MAFTEEQQQHVIRALDAKITQPCPSCGQKNRQLIPELLMLPLQPPLPTLATIPRPWLSNESIMPPPRFPQGQVPKIPTPPPSGYVRMPPPPPPPPLNIPVVLPCVVVVCLNCGNTDLYNVHVLGVAELLGVHPPGVAV